MNASDIDRALNILNFLVDQVQRAISSGIIVPDADLTAALSNYDALLEECSVVPYELSDDYGFEDEMYLCAYCGDYHHGYEQCSEQDESLYDDWDDEYEQD